MSNIESGYECIYFEDMIEKFTSVSKKVLVYFKVCGLYNSGNTEKVEYYKEVYKTMLPSDIYTMVTNYEHFFVEFDSIDEAINFCEDNFPISTREGEPEAYIHYEIYNQLGQVIAQN